MTKFMRSTAIAFLPALLLIGLPMATQAGPVTWNYSGNATTDCVDGPCTEDLLNDSLNLSVTFNASLAANLIEQGELSNITSWAVTDTRGYIDYSSSTSGSLAAELFSTDNAGNIIDVSEVVVYGPGWNASAPGSSAAGIVSLAGGLVIGGIGTYDEIGVTAADGTQSAAASTVEGTWSLASGTPEPSTGFLMVLGAGILVLARRRKYRLAIQTPR
jgi:hypothetical protein